jgi:ABC-type tungstate transport system permease subunit
MINISQEEKGREAGNGICPRSLQFSFCIYVSNGIQSVAFRCNLNGNQAFRNINNLQERNFGNS